MLDFKNMKKRDEIWRKKLEELFSESLRASHPDVVLPSVIPPANNEGEDIVIGAGKASIEMASVFYNNLGSNVVGAVVTRHGQGENIKIGGIRKLYGGHPIPDKSSVDSAREIVRIAKSAKKYDRVHFLVSGGGSAILTLPVDGLSLDRMRHITDHLVKSGLPIEDINCVRRHLSQVKGGRLAKLIEPANLTTYAISDVVGDSPSDIASGPTVASENEPDRVMQLLLECGYPVDQSLESVIQTNLAPSQVDGNYKIVASSTQAVRFLQNKLESLGWSVVCLGADLQGSARSVGASHSEFISSYCLNKSGRFAFISGGELTVKVENDRGAGGPNLEYLTALMLGMNEQIKYSALAADTDGIDGSEDNAGGVIHDGTKSWLEQRGINIERYLLDNNTYPLFEQFDGLVKTGPTGTNVNDIRIVLVDITEKEAV